MPTPERKTLGLYFPAKGGRTAVTLDLSRKEELEIWRATRGVSAPELRSVLGGRMEELERAAIEAGRSFKAEVISRLSAAIEKGKLTPGEGDYAGWPAGSARERDEVAGILREHPRLRRVLDPFAGTATFPIAAGQLGRTAMYCEISAVQRTVAAARIKALQWSDRRRRQAARVLEDVLLEEMLASASRKGEREDETQQLARLLARQRQSHPDTAVLLEAAILRSLPQGRSTSTPRAKGSASLVETLDRLRGELRSAAAFLREEPRLVVAPKLVGTDAKGLKNIRSLKLDGVISNPPSLNLMKYESGLARAMAGEEPKRRERRFASSKFEEYLQAAVPQGAERRRFLRFLAELREKVAAGHPQRRIMNYAFEMAVVVRSFESHLRPHATVVFDVPDSRVGGVFVDTASLLLLLLECHGFHKTSAKPAAMRAAGTGELRRVVLIVER
jgi:hypothetical protein